MIRDFDSSSTSGIHNPLGYLQQRKSIQVGNKIIFNASGLSTGQELWVSDGSEAGTHILKEIEPGLDWIEANAMVKFDSLMFCYLLGSPNNFGVWKSDGTESGTVKFTNDQYGGNCGGVTMVSKNEGFFGCVDLDGITV